MPRDCGLGSGQAKDKVLFAGIQDKQRVDQIKNSTGTVFSSADELKKFKELLDSGIISQEEFDAKKKQLLNL